KRNINLSTRLLFAPPKVIDYVIIHELAHLVEMNHSRRFWDLVAAAMPDYEEQEKWLKKFGHRCDF
ncbi:MAG: M48 family metallopeptidase, partial [Saprospiraceae bacterium]|nr:M48 family metallopeptidase [Saprospiraceae bacterium]